jgi:RNA recognition motif-containing protein
MASNNNAPKYGTRVPNRVFVGGLSGDTTEAEMEGLFSNYGQVSSAKIISDRAGVSKGYGFITFETEEQARNLLKMSEVYLKNRKLNIAPAIKKQVRYCCILYNLSSIVVVDFCVPIFPFKFKCIKKKNALLYSLFLQLIIISLYPNFVFIYFLFAPCYFIILVFKISSLNYCLHGAYFLEHINDVSL